MNKVKIICDSTIDLTNDLYKKLDIEIIPLHVNFGTEDFLDGVNITISDLYKKVDEFGELPHTAGISISVFEEYFKKYIDQGMDVIYLGLSSCLSSTFQNAYIAKQSFPDDRIFLVDSKNLSSASGILAIKAAKLRDENKSAAEIAIEIEKMVPNLVGQFVVEDFEYLYKGGRCSGAAKIVGTLLHMHPYLKVVDGKIIVYKKPRGPLKVAIIEQLNELKKDLDNLDKDVVIITHSSEDKAIINWLEKEIRTIPDIKNIYTVHTGAVIGSHCGPGTVAIFYLKK